MSPVQVSSQELADNVVFEVVVRIANTERSIGLVVVTFEPGR